MKKFTLLLLAMLAFCWQSQAQFTFPTEGPLNVVSGTPEEIGLNTVGNTAGVTAAEYDSFELTVTWTAGGGGPWSSEAEALITTSAGSVDVDGPSSGGANDGTTTTLTFIGNFPANYNPSVNGLLGVAFDTSYGGSDMDLTDIVMVLYEAPTCDVVSGITIDAFTDTTADVSWTASITGETAWEIAFQGSGAGAPAAAGDPATSVYNKTGLTESTTYDVYVRADCTGGDYGDWVGPVSFTTPASPVSITCPGPDLNETYCYSNNDETEFKYVSSDGSNLRVTFNAGDTEDTYDELIILDSDGVTELYNGYGASGDLTGVSATSSGDSITVKVSSDGSTTECSTGADWDWDIECLACTPSIVDTITVIEDCGSGTFDVEVTFSSLGDALFIVGTSEPYPFESVVPGTFTYTLSGYISGTDADLSINHSSPVCDYDLATQTYNCPPDNDLCADATAIACNDTLTGQSTISATGASATSCDGSIGNDVWYQYTGDDSDVTITVNATVEEAQIGVFTSTDGACSGITLGSCSDSSAGSGGNPVSVTFAADVGTEYFIQVGNWINGDPGLEFEISATCIPYPTTAPDCPATYTATPDATCGSLETTLAWDASTPVVADGYYLTVGTTMGGNDIIDNVDLGNVLTTTVSSQTVNTQYYYTISPYNDFGTAVCAEQTYTTIAAGCYCTSEPTSNDNNGISNVTIDATSFPTGDVTYFDHSGTPVDFSQGLTAPVSITFETGYAYGTNIWIDFNDDYILDPSELVFSGESLSTNPTTFDASFPMPVSATLGTHKMRIGTAYSGQDTPNACYNGSYGVTLDFDVNIVAPSCTAIAINSSTIVENCGAGTFDVVIDVASIGAATFKDDAVNGSEAIVAGINTYTYNLGEVPDITILHSDIACNLALGTFQYDDCPTLVDCAGGTPVNTTFCYTNNDETMFAYQSSDASSLKVTFNAGDTENNYDELIILDSDGVTELYNGYGAAGDLTGVTANSTGDIIYVKVSSDGSSTSCSFGDDWDWDVECLACTPGVVDTTVISDTCGGTDEFTVTVNLTTVNDATGVSDGTNTYAFTGSTAVAGPYPVGTTETLTLLHTDVSCDSSLGDFTYVCPPANDACANAIALTVNPDFACGTVTSGDLYGATADGESEATCAGAENDDVWYTFVATSTAHRIELSNISGTPTDMYHSLWEGACGTLTNLVCSDGNTSNPTGLTIGNTYTVRVNSYSGNAGATTTFDICIGTPPPPPANDECIDAIALTVNPDYACGTVTAGTIQSATASGEDEATCSGAETDDVWYTFVATATTHRIEIQNVTPYTDMYHSLWEGACGTLTNVDCTDSNTSNPTGLTIGNTYTLRVNSYGTSSSSSTFDICISTAPPAPANDECADAIALTVNPDYDCGTVTAGSIAGATASGESEATCSGTENDDVWYTFVATHTEHRVELSNVTGTPTDLYHSVWEGACGTLTNLTCSDSDTSTTSGLTIGNTYTVRVNSYSSNSGAFTSFDICIGSQPPPPANDTCAGAVVVTPGAYGSCTTTSFDNEFATYSGALGSCESFDVGTEQDVWFTFSTDAVSTSINVEVTDGTPGNLDMSVYDACAGTEVACAATLTAGLNTLTGLTPSTTYWLQVWTESTTSGAYDLCFSYPPLCTPVDVTSSTVVENCGAQQFSIEIVVADEGSAGSVFDDGTATTPVVSGTTTLGPYNFGDNITVNITAVDSNCDGSLGTFNSTCPPPNDDFANAIALNCGDTVFGDTTTATLDEDDAPDATGFNADTDSPNMWYSFYGTGETLDLDTCLDGTDFDTEILVFTGTSGNLTLEASGYDDCNGTNSDYLAQASLVTSPGIQYWISVEGYNVGSIGAFEMSVTCSGTAAFVYNNGWVDGSNPIGTTTTNDIVIASGDVNLTANTGCNTFTVLPGAGVTVDAGVTLTPTAGLLLDSNSTSYSSLILDGTVTGTMTYERHVNINASSGTTTGSNDLVSAPLTGQPFNTFAAANPNILTNAGGTLYLFGPFEKVTGQYVTWADTETSTLDPGVGYRAGSVDNDTFTFTGTANNGVVTNDLVNAGSNNAIWNLVGNPYPSYLNVWDFLAHDLGDGTTNIQLFDTGTEAIYGYDGSHGNGWTIYNYATTLPSTVIAPGQGFMVSANAAQTAGYDLEFSPDMRRTGSSDDFIVGRNAQLTYVKLDLSTANKSYGTDIYFNNNASSGFDAGYDAAIWGETAPDFAIYSHLIEENNGKAMALQAVDHTDLSDISIPLGVNANQDEELRFSISEITLPASVNVYLEDRVKNTITLLNNADYVINPSAALSGTGRFFLRTSQGALTTIDNSISKLDIYTLKASDELVISGELLSDNTMLNVFDIQGRLVLSTKLDDTILENRINVSSINSGVYIVTVQNNSQEETKKVIID
ncbi:T9SS type A sorting domain-containing protein [Psychroserpens ponticola]|uniref:T9SS type A sorting domain-containing protein n=1 Tax=Psychroserpens ponticola TaxID=2932268 RepID=A0ABY7RVM6_9FLAO|nr:T9SS type A sorting domain-containing protein [Psychroserpens ponticola]WCO01152.1 T9SS type A sorting domain-containing protein [Psychroserpens ponticola]